MALLVEHDPSRIRCRCRRSRDHRCYFFEPANGAVFEANAHRYVDQWPDRVARSQAVPREFLESFYLRTYDCVRPAMEAGAALVLHDRFDPLASWKRFMPRRQFGNVWIDTHRYLVFSGHQLKGRTIQGQLRSHRRLIRSWGRQVRAARRHHDVLVGEWCLSNHVGPCPGGSAPQDAILCLLADSQIKAWSKASGACFWSLRNGAAESDAWSFEAALGHGWL